MSEIKKRKSFADMIKYPSRHFLSLLYMIEISAIALALIVFISGTKNEFLVLYGYINAIIGLVTFAYTLFVFILFTPRMRKIVTATLQRNSFIRSLLGQYGYRTVITTTFAIVFNVAFIVMNGVIALRYMSIWYGIYTMFYTVVAWLRVLLVLHSRPGNGSKYQIDEGRKYESSIVCLLSGLILVVFSAALSPSFFRINFTTSPYVTPEPLVFIIGAWTLYKIIEAIISMIRTQRNDDFSISTLRTLVLVNALIAIPAFQASMLNLFYDGTSKGYANSVTGFAVCVIIIGLGVYTVIFAIKNIVYLKRYGALISQGSMEEDVIALFNKKERKKRRRADKNPLHRYLKEIPLTPEMKMGLE
ncbi:MAG: hypothetical protein J6126_02165 [Clostridia bacterium]|nr:hypothetical protein [Clostridia bacterium]